MSGLVFSGHQPNFLPYMGFFYKMYRSDVFVLDDDVQYSHGNDSFQNANFLKIGGEKHKITVPVSYEQGDLIKDVRINYARDWPTKLLKTIRMNYGKAPYFEQGYVLIDEAVNRKYEYLAELNTWLILTIKTLFGIECGIQIASIDLPTSKRSNERNVYQGVMLGADVYFSGAGGRAYNDEEMYREAGIKILYSDYEPARYRQFDRKPFISNLSVLDYIFNCGFEIPEQWRTEK